MVLLAGIGALGFGGERIVASKASSGTAAGRAPRCVPSKLNRSSVLPGTPLSVSPLPYSYDASARTQISFLGVAASALSHVRASGSSSGGHGGRLLAYSQGDGASFVASKAFAPGETVTVRGSVSAAGARRSFSYKFVVATQDAIGHPAGAKEPAGGPGDVQSFRSRPDLKPPSIGITTPPAAGAAAGYVMASPYSGPGQDGPLIFDDTGQVVWFDPLPNGTEATNVRVQQLGGAPVLTWWQGYIPPQGFGQGVDMIADSSYRQTPVRAGNGYQADLHDFLLTARGTALLTVFNPIRCDLSRLGGAHETAVTDGVLQEVDLKSRLVRREWHSVDHVGLSESYSSIREATTAWPFDYFHINSVDLHADGTLLISARNTSALYELDGRSGQVVMRVGGRRSSVRMGKGATTAFQHDATELPSGLISVFDNGAVPKVHSQSRGLLLRVDAKAKTNTLVAQFTYPKPLSSGSQGSIQSLAGGNVLIGWGPLPFISEFSASGKLLFDAHLPKDEQSYRAYRSVWTGKPANAPAVAAAAAGSASGAAGALDVYASWNGATGVVSWRVLGGASPSALTPVATAVRSGFETTILTPGAEAYVAVQALDSSGAVLATSRTIPG